MYRRNFCKLGIAGIGTLAISKPVSALDHMMKVPQNRWAILYGSQCGSTRVYANAINEGLGGIADVVDIAITTPTVDDYDFFIIGGWRSSNSVMPDSIPNFINSNKDALKEKIKGLFVVLGNHGNATLDASLTAFLNEKLVTPAEVSEDLGKVFFGKSDPQCNGLTGFSYDNVNENEGKAFGEKILGETTGILHPASGVRQGFQLSRSTRPFSRVSTIHYTLSYNADVLLTICSMSGRKLTTLVSQHQSAGSYTIQWDGSNLAPGYYLYRLQVGDKIETRTASVVK